MGTLKMVKLKDRNISYEKEKSKCTGTKGN